MMYDDMFMEWVFRGILALVVIGAVTVVAAAIYAARVVLS